MKVTIGSSSREEIKEIYKESAKEVIQYLVSKKFDLTWGCGSSSIMGICYNEFKNSNLNIYGFTTDKYKSDLDSLKYANNIICKNTFDLKKHLFSNSDFILMLPGGTGTISEFFAFLEEIRSNEKNIPLILYNKDGHFNTMLALIDDLIERKFNDKSIYDYFLIVNSLDEFIRTIEKL